MKKANIVGRGRLEALIIKANQEIVFLGFYFYSNKSLFPETLVGLKKYYPEGQRGETNTNKAI